VRNDPGSAEGIGRRPGDELPAKPYHSAGALRGWPSAPYFFVLLVSFELDPVVVCWPGALSEWPGPAVVLFWWPGAYSEAPGAVDLALGCCICWPGAYC